MARAPPRAAAAHQPKGALLLLTAPRRAGPRPALRAVTPAPTRQGGLLVVSHDEHLITSVCETLMIVDEGRVWEHNGDFNSYRKQQLAKSKLRS